MKPRYPKWIIIIVVLAILVVVAIFLKKDESQDIITPEKPDYEEIVVPEELSPIKGEFGDEQIYYPAKPTKITVKGRYVYSEDIKSSTVGKVCFEPNEDSTGLGENICFDNKDEAFAIFGIQRGFSDGSLRCTVSAPATIEIMGYSKLTADVGGYDSATITKVVSVGEQSFENCN